MGKLVAGAFAGFERTMIGKSDQPGSYKYAGNSMRKYVLKDDRADSDTAQTVYLRQNRFSSWALVNLNQPPGTNCWRRQMCTSVQHDRYGPNTSPPPRGLR